MIAAFDVHYTKTNLAWAAVILFSDYAATTPEKTIRQIVSVAADYIPGDFYKRELPCILALLRQIHPPPSEIIVDGYARLGQRPGLGQHLFQVLDGKIPVIGVAKSKFEGAPAEEILRGTSRRPLYITAVGMDPMEASEKIKRMGGSHRIPELLRQVDLAAKGVSPFGHRRLQRNNHTE